MHLLKETFENGEEISIHRKPRDLGELAPVKADWRTLRAGVNVAKRDLPIGVATCGRRADPFTIYAHGAQFTNRSCLDDTSDGKRRVNQS